jgi:hypothetical protein
MPPDLNQNACLDQLSINLKIALSRLETSKRGNIHDIFSHVKKPSLGTHQKAWEAACINQLAHDDLLIFDDSDGEIVLIAASLSSIFKNSDKIWELVTKAYDSVTGSSIWEEVSTLITETQAAPIIQESTTIQILEPEPTLVSVPTPTLELLDETIDGGDEDEDEDDDGDEDEPSWERISEFFPENKVAILLSFRESVRKLASGGKWTRPELFRELHDINVELQRDFLRLAVEDGLLDKEGDRKSRKYWLISDRSDYDSFQLIARLVYPSIGLDAFISQSRQEVSQQDGYDDSDTLGNLIRALTIQTQHIEKLEKKIDSQSTVIEELKLMVGKLLGESDGK